MKLRVCVIFGGMSCEHDVSITSSKYVIMHLDKDKYDIQPIYIDSNGIWYKASYEFNEELLEEIDDVFSCLKQFDVIFPVLHGKYGEDGSIQGMFEMLKIPYVGCGVFASSSAMDKVYTKFIMKGVGIKQSDYVYIRKVRDRYDFVYDDFSYVRDSLSNICDIVEKKIKYPMFVKPSNCGSSIGISKVSNRDELLKAIDLASSYDVKIVIEEEVVGREIECAVLGNDDVRVSCLGEIKSAESFYTFEAKYDNPDSKIIIPANIDVDLLEEVKKIAKRAFMAIDGKGLARVDFFVNDKTGDIFINEINTMPGFTSISMYPKLWESSGLEYDKLLDELIILALER